MFKNVHKLAAPMALAAALVSFVPQNVLADENTARKEKTFFADKEIRVSESKTQISDIHNRELLISSKSSIQPFITEHNLTKVRSFKSGQNLISIVKVPEKVDYSHILKSAASLQGVTAVEPNRMKEHLSVSSAEDPYVKEQWYLQNTGILKAWGTFNFTRPVKVAVLDTGINFKHQEFLGGQILPGYDFVNNDEDASDDAGHGTEVAGVIAASANNSAGIAGVAANIPGIKILPVKIGSPKGAEVADEVRGIDYAIKQGADIINISFGSPEPSQAEYDAILRASAAGILVVSSAGNEGQYRMPVSYPAGYPEVLSVGSVNSQNKRSVFSNTGEALDLMAPGEGIVVPTMQGGYNHRAAGTSFSAPIVSGMGALLLSAGNRLTPFQIEYLLESSCVKLPGYTGWNTSTGFGAVNLFNALNTELPNMGGDSGSVRKTARILAVNKSFTDKYQLPNDVDWYVIKAAKSMKVKVDVSAIPGIDHIVWSDRVVNGKMAEEQQHDAKNLGGGESFTLNVKPGSNYIQIFEANSHYSTRPYTLKLTELDTTAPWAPYVYAITSKSTVIKGKSEKGATIRITYGTKTLRTFKIPKTTTAFSVSIPKQPAGRVLYLTATDAAGNKSKATRITVKK